MGVGGAVPQGRGRGLIVLLENGREGTAGQTIDWLYSIVRSSSYLRLCPFDSGYITCLLCNVKGVAITCPSLQDPHGELKGQNVLIVRGSLEDTAQHFSLGVEETRELLGKCRGVLFAERQKRPKPHRDDKILTAWNGKHL